MYYYFRHTIKHPQTRPQNALHFASKYFDLWLVGVAYHPLALKIVKRVFGQGLMAGVLERGFTVRVYRYM